MVNLRSHPVLQRVLQALLVAFSVFVVAFCIMRLAPGDPVRTLLGDLATDELVASLREELGLNGSFLEQFWSYARGAATGDLGTSIVTGETVVTTIGRMLPVTLWLMVVTLSIAIAISIPLALFVALSRRAVVGHAFRALTSISLATPVFFTALVAILVFGMRLEIAPIAGYEPGFPGKDRKSVV